MYQTLPNCSSHFHDNGCHHNLFLHSSRKRSPIYKLVYHGPHSIWSLLHSDILHWHSCKRSRRINGELPGRAQLWGWIHVGMPSRFERRHVSLQLSKPQMIYDWILFIFMQSLDPVCNMNYIYRTIIIKIIKLTEWCYVTFRTILQLGA